VFECFLVVIIGFESFLRIILGFFEGLLRGCYSILRVFDDDFI
jgi:hypothetical protein